MSVPVRPDANARLRLGEYAAVSTYGTAIGTSATAASRSVALGTFASAGRNAIAIGPDASAEEGEIIVGDLNLRDMAAEIQELRKIVAEQQEMLRDLWYAPGNPGYQESKKLFMEERGSKEPMSALESRYYRGTVTLHPAPEDGIFIGESASFDEPTLEERVEKLEKTVKDLQNK